MNNGIGKKPRENLTGRLFGRLTVERPAEDRVLSNGRHLTMWECRCSCGNHTIIRSSDLKSGRVVSCGCYRAENTGVIRTTHGATKGIVIDRRRTPNAYEEFVNYEYERNKDGDIISGYPDENNHLIDATRYALERVFRRMGVTA